MGKARKPAPKKKRLTLEEIRFVHLYFAGETSGNATRSYEQAGFPPRESLGAVSEAASQLLKKPEIIEYLDAVKRDATEAEMVTTRSVVRGFKWGADADVTVTFDDDGNMLPKSQWPAELKAAIQSVKIEPIFEEQADPTDASKTKKVRVGTRYEIKLENKTECRKALAQILKMVGPDAETPQQERKPLVVKGADPDKL